MKPNDKKKGKLTEPKVTTNQPINEQNEAQNETSQASIARQRPQKPTYQEKRMYYTGMEYKLVARSSHHDWDKTKTKQVGRQEMDMKPVGQHANFLLFWNGRGANSLQLLVRNALSSLDVINLEAVQMGFADQNNTDWPIVICATIKKNSATWEEAVDATMKVKEVLESWDFEDIECEVREGK